VKPSTLRLLSAVWVTIGMLGLSPCVGHTASQPAKEAAASAVEKEIEIYRETLKFAKAFTPDDLEDLSRLEKVAGNSTAQAEAH
jgi:hypothetical protein